MKTGQSRILEVITVHRLRAFTRMMAVVFLGSFIGGCLTPQPETTPMGKTLDEKISVLDGTIHRIQSQLDKIEDSLTRKLEQLDTLQRRVETQTQQVFKQQAGHEKRLSIIEQGRQKQLSQFAKDQERVEQKLNRVAQTLKEDLGMLIDHLKALGPVLESLVEKVDVRLEEQGKAIVATRDHTHKRVQQVETQTQTLHEQITMVGGALTKFKHSLADLEDRFGQENDKVGKLSESTSRERKAVTERLEDIEAALREEIAGFQIPDLAIRRGVSTAPGGSTLLWDGIQEVDIEIKGGSKQPKEGN